MTVVIKQEPGIGLLKAIEIATFEPGEDNKVMVFETLDRRRIIGTLCDDDCVDLTVNKETISASSQFGKLALELLTRGAPFVVKMGSLKIRWTILDGGGTN